MTKSSGYIDIRTRYTVYVRICDILTFYFDIYIYIVRVSNMYTGNRISKCIVPGREDDKLVERDNIEIYIVFYN